MCYHTSNKHPQAKKMEEEFRRQTRFPELYTPFYHMNGYDHEVIQGLSQNEDEIVPMRWGIVPPGTLNIQAYWKEFGGKCLNTKSEYVFDNIRTSDAILHNRVVIPVTGFFEPHDRGDISFPYFIKPVETEYLGMLGCAVRYDEMYLFTILTTVANDFVGKIHNIEEPRMPIMVSPDKADDWLDPTLERLDIRDIINDHVTPKLEAWPVMKSVTNSHVKTNVPQALERYDYPVQGTLF
ncbi:SOS response-associated peptidase [Spongiimicrobium salis]|uniref:SOS response-associated peptidase n=1 Tax=Spongiimicrobium salis TaxID=1667022 RepID=UPI00374CA1CE